jgi:hypothetical protein
MIELRDLLLMLRKGESIKSIHRTTRRHKTVIRTLKTLAEEHHWLLPDSEIPSEAELKEAWERNAVRKTAEREPKCHPLDVLKDDFTRWIAEDTSFVVMHKLASGTIPCSEATVRRYLHRRFPNLPEPVIPRHHEPGKVMDVDFGYLGLIDDESTGRIRKAWLFSGRLRYSRKAFRAIVFTQEQQVFFACHIDAFEWFGGIPAMVTPDNLKAAVIKASWEDPLVNRAYRNLAEHYGFAISPCLPATPEHKGGVESDVKYAKGNFWPLLKERELKLGHAVPRAKAAVHYLAEWNDTVCETRKISKVGRTVPELFAIESKVLRPLPSSRWDPMDCALAKVGVDWRIQFQKSFYSVPYRYIGEKVLVTATRHTVRIYHDSRQIAVHSKATRNWQTQVKVEHGPPEMEVYLATCSKGLVQAACGMGVNVGLMADAILEDRAVDGLRPLRALVGLKERYSVQDIDRICARLLSFGITGYTSVKTELKRETLLAASPQPVFRFAREAAYYQEAIHG